MREEVQSEHSLTVQLYFYVDVTHDIAVRIACAVLSVAYVPVHHNPVVEELG